MVQLSTATHLRKSMQVASTAHNRPHLPCISFRMIYDAPMHASQSHGDCLLIWWHVIWQWNILSIWSEVSANGIYTLARARSEVVVHADLQYNVAFSSLFWQLRFAALCEPMVANGGQKRSIHHCKHFRISSNMHMSPAFVNYESPYKKSIQIHDNSKRIQLARHFSETA